jgi:hypothetical protein
MVVFDRLPGDWRELQAMVGQLFAEMGCEVEVGKVVDNVRGAKEIDVYVRDTSVAPAALYLCECKHWQRAVPQEIVHSFRTVLQDTGAHRGYIISSGGFQSGAFEAAKNTNLDLLSFPELQDIFFDRWRMSMGERLMPYADRLFPYWDYPGRMPRFQWNKSHTERQEQLTSAYQPLLHLGPLARMEGFKRQFPIILPAVDQRGNIGGEVRIETYRQLYDFIDSNKDIALHHFQVLHGEIVPDKLRGEYDPMA